MAKKRKTTKHAPGTPKVKVPTGQPYKFFNSCDFQYHPIHHFWAYLPTSHDASMAQALKANPSYWRIRGVQAMIADYKFKVAGMFYPHVFKPWNLMRLYEWAEKTERYPDVHFLRWWLDQIILWEGYSFWNHVYNKKLEELRGERNANKKAEAAADAVVAEFEVMFE